MADKRMTEDEVVAELRSGMTIGIGGWGSRRKPMSLVRAILRSELRDLTVVSYGGPDIGLLCAAGKVGGLRIRPLDSIPLEPNFRRARQSGAIQVTEYDEGMLQLGLYAASIRVPFLPTRAGLGSGVMTVNPELRTVTSPYADGEELVAVPALHLDAALVHLNRADAAGNAAFLGPDLYFDDLYCLAAERAYRLLRAHRADRGAGRRGWRPLAAHPSLMVSGVVESPNGAHFTSCLPDYGRDEAFQKEYATAAADPALWVARRGIPARGRDTTPSTEGGPREQSRPTSTPVAAVASGHLYAATRANWPPKGGMGVTFSGPSTASSPVPTRGVVTARSWPRRWAPHRRSARGWPGPASSLTCSLPTARPRWSREPGRSSAPPPKVLEGYLPYRMIFDLLWSGRRHVMMGPSQIDRFGNVNISAIGEFHRPTRQLLGVRGAPGNTVSHPTSYWVAKHGPRTFVERVDLVCGVGYDSAAAAGPAAQRFLDLRRVVSNLGVFDFATPDHRMRLASVHPGVTVDEVVTATGFELAIPADVPVTRDPTAEEARLIREVLDPKGLRDREVPS